VSKSFRGWTLPLWEKQIIRSIISIFPVPNILFIRTSFNYQLQGVPKSKPLTYHWIVSKQKPLIRLEFFIKSECKTSARISRFCINYSSRENVSKISLSIASYFVERGAREPDSAHPKISAWRPLCQCVCVCVCVCVWPGGTRFGGRAETTTPPGGENANDERSQLEHFDERDDWHSDPESQLTADVRNEANDVVVWRLGRLDDVAVGDVNHDSRQQILLKYINNRPTNAYSNWSIVWQRQSKVVQIRVYITTNQPDTTSNPNPNPTTKQHAIVNVQLNIVTCLRIERNSFKTCYCSVCTTFDCNCHTAKLDLLHGRISSKQRTGRHLASWSEINQRVSREMKAISLNHIES